MLLFVVALSCHLGWSLWNPERTVVAEIERAGGKVYRQYENASVIDVWLSVARIPDFVYLDTLQVETIRLSERPPLPTAWEVLSGTYRANRVTVVDLPLDRMTPDMVEKLQSLRDLNAVVVRVTGGVMLRKGSPQAQRLEELATTFSGKFHSTYAPGD